MSAATNAPHTYIIGHRNPDADAVCSAIAYAALKQAQGHTGFVAARCGNTNARIDTILNRFKQPAPVYLTDVTPRVRDVMIEDVIGVASEQAGASGQIRSALEAAGISGAEITPLGDAGEYIIRARTT